MPVVFSIVSWIHSGFLQSSVPTSIRPVTLEIIGKIASQGFKVAQSKVVNVCFSQKGQYVHNLRIPEWPFWMSQRIPLSSLIPYLLQVLSKLEPYFQCDWLTKISVEIHSCYMSCCSRRKNGTTILQKKSLEIATFSSTGTNCMFDCTYLYWVQRKAQLALRGILDFIQVLFRYNDLRATLVGGVANFEGLSLPTILIQLSVTRIEPKRSCLLEDNPCA